MDPITVSGLTALVVAAKTAATSTGTYVAFNGLAGVIAGAVGGVSATLFSSQIFSGVKTVGQSIGSLFYHQPPPVAQKKEAIEKKIEEHSSSYTKIVVAQKSIKKETKLNTQKAHKSVHQTSSQLKEHVDMLQKHIVENKTITTEIRQSTQGIQEEMKRIKKENVALKMSLQASAKELIEMNTQLKEANQRLAILCDEKTILESQVKMDAFSGKEGQLSVITKANLSTLLDMVKQLKHENKQLELMNIALRAQGQGHQHGLTLSPKH